MSKTIRVLLVQWLDAHLDEYGRGGVAKITTSEIDQLAIPYVLDRREKHTTVRSSVTRAWRELMRSHFNTKTHKYRIETTKTDSGRRLWIVTRTNNF